MMIRGRLRVGYGAFYVESVIDRCGVLMVWSDAKCSGVSRRNFFFSRPIPEAGNRVRGLTIIASILHNRESLPDLSPCDGV